MTAQNQNPPWLNYLEHDVIGKTTASDARVYEVVVKVNGTGLLAIIKARKGDQYLVAFVGGRSFAGLSGAVRKRIVTEPEKWRADQYARP